MPTTASEVKIPGVVPELLDALLADAMSDPGPDESGPGSIDVMSNWVTPDEAGIEVGLKGKHVLRLCSAGLVRHTKVGGGRYLVEAGDLRRHLREAS